jgi:hypothetical protein
MRFTRLSLGALTLLLLVAVPVSAAPSLTKTSQANYDLTVSISFLQSCGPILGSTLSPGIVCPMIAMTPSGLDFNGTVGWAVTGLSGTTANLNVTRDLTISNGETVTPTTRHAGSFNESIDLATRIATILPFIEPEMDQALQMVQTSMASSMPTGVDWSSTMTTIDDTMLLQPIHTMWWVNGPLKVNDTVPVLVFPTNVTGSTSVDLGSAIGTRSAWVLEVINKTRSLPPPDPLASASASFLIANDFEFSLAFNYDKASDLLLSASADIHFGFRLETTIQPNPCNPSATTVCPASYPVPILRELGIDVQASLKLRSTNVDLSQRLMPTDSSQTPTSGGQSNGGSNPGTGQTTGGSGTGPTSGSNLGSASGPTSGSTSGSNSPSTGSQQPASNPAQSKPPSQSASLLPWLYGILGLIAAAIVSSGVWIARRRMKKTRSQVPMPQP